MDEVIAWLERTERAQVLDRLADEVERGLTLATLLAALAAAASRNVLTTKTFSIEQHTLLTTFPVLRSAGYLGWRSAMWGVDYFKWAQHQPAARAGAADAIAAMPPMTGRALPAVAAAPGVLDAALGAFDGERAEAAVVALLRAGEHEKLAALLHRHGARDFRHIGHKAIHVSNALRTLASVGWDHAEPVLRSAARTLALHYTADGLDPDGAWLTNQRRIDRLRAGWEAGARDDAAIAALVARLRDATQEEACDAAVDHVNRGVSARAIWDAVLVSASELMMNNPTAIEALHAVTASNAAHASYLAATDEADRRLLLLQGVARVAGFHRYVAWWNQRRKTRTEPPVAIDTLEPLAGASHDEIFADVGGDPEQRVRAARRTLGLLLEHPEQLDAFATRAHGLALAAAEDTHDLKLCAAVHEDAAHLSPAWRARYVAACTSRLRGTGAPASETSQRIDRLIAARALGPPRA